MIKFIFILSIFLVFYIYLGYPLVVLLVSLRRSRPVKRAPGEPKVTILIAAYNEEKSIRATLENKLSLDYLKDKLEIIVISDGSTDKTDAIVQLFSGANVRLLRQEPRAGKTLALNLGVSQASGEIIVFSDANSLYAPDALQHLVSNFNDPEVGYVSGQMIYVDPDGTTIGDGCSAYMKYENYLRRLETKIGSIVGVDGGIDAIRKELYITMNADQLPDFVLPLKVVEQGYRVVYDPRAILKEASLKEAADEYRMRVRVSLRALWALYDTRNLLVFGRNPLFAWQLWSHKVLRYLCFVFLVGAYFSNGLLLEEGLFFESFFIFQTSAYFVAFSSWFLAQKGLDFGIIILVRYFVLLNLAAAHAFGKFILRKKQIIWVPRKG